MYTQVSSLVCCVTALQPLGKEMLLTNGWLLAPEGRSGSLEWLRRTSCGQQGHNKEWEIAEESKITMIENSSFVARKWRLVICLKVRAHM